MDDERSVTNEYQSLEFSIRDAERSIRGAERSRRATIAVAPWCAAAKLLVCVSALAGWAAVAALAQQGVAADAVHSTAAAERLPLTTLEALRQMEAQAGVVCAGEVVAIRRIGAERPAAGGGSLQSTFVGNAGVVEVDIRVEDAVRGCTAGAHYMLREWAGLWVNQAQRYRLGQRAVWLLHSPNAAGMSSPVGGMVGVLPLTGRGAQAQVDLRWVKTRVARPLVVLPDAVDREKVVGAKVARGSTAKDWKPPLLAGAAYGAARVQGAAKMGLAGASQSQDYDQVQAALENPTASYTTLLGVLHGMEAVRDGMQR